MNNTLLLALILVSASVTAAMASSAENHVDAHDSEVHEDGHKSSRQDDGIHGRPHWGYSGVEGPVHWGSLAKEFSLCGSGKEQSPINIKGEQEMNLLPLEFHYRDSSHSQVVNNGHTIQVDYAQGSYAIIGGKKFELLQFHFHSPSEHKIHGKHADLVAHLVHKSAEGNLAVVAILFDRGVKSRFLDSVWRVMPRHKGKATVSGTIDITDLLPKEKKVRYFNYRGSLTTPPCSEGVNWNILLTRASVSSAQVKAFERVFPRSVRPIQALNARIIGVN